MNNLYIEHRLINEKVALTWDLALHLYARPREGVVVIISENPTVLMSALRKQWLKIVRKLNVERSATLDSRRRNEISQRIRQMEATQFAVGIRNGINGEVIYFLAMADLPVKLDGWHTAYIVTVRSDEEWTAALSQRMKKHGLIVKYELASGQL